MCSKDGFKLVYVCGGRDRVCEWVWAYLNVCAAVRESEKDFVLENVGFFNQT